MRPIRRVLPATAAKTEPKARAAALIAAISRRFGDSANQSYAWQERCLVYFESNRGMTAPDDLLRTVNGLKELLRLAWSKLADPLLTSFDRREARHQIKQHSAELRRYLRTIETSRTGERSPEEHSDPAPKKPDLRFLG